MKKIVACLSGSLCTVVMPVSAMDWSVSAGLATEYTNNSLKSATDKQWDYSYISQAGGNFNHRSSDFDVLAAYDLAYTTFENNTQSSETAVNGQANAHWFILPETLTWNFNQQNSRQKQQAGIVDTTDTRTTQSVFSTGPSSNLRLSPRDLLKLSADAMEVSTSGANDNSSNRGIISAAIAHSTSAIQTVGVQVSRQDVNYDEQGTPDVVFMQSAIEWNRQYRLGRLQASVGKNSSKRDGFDTHTGNYYQFFADYNNVGNVVSIAAMRSLTDSMLGLYAPGFAVSSKPTEGAENNFMPESTALDVIDVVDDRQIDVNYSTIRLCDRCSVSLRADFNEQDYLVQLLDKRAIGVQAGLSYDFSARWSSRITWSRAKEDYLDSDREDKTTQYGVELNHQYLPELVIKGQLRSDKRDSNQESLSNSVATARIGFLYFFGNSPRR